MGGQLLVRELIAGIGDAADLVVVVEHHDDGAVRLQTQEQFLDDLRGLPVEGRRRFIEEEDLRLKHEGAGDAEALLLTTREDQGVGVEAVLDLVPQESARYDSVKETLVGRGIIQTGKGRGGSVKLPE